MREKPVSGLCEMRMQYSPDALASTPRSPSFASTLQMMEPSGMLPTGSTLPTTSCAFLPQYRNCPVYVPSAATKSSFWCWKRLELRNVTCSCRGGRRKKRGGGGSWSARERRRRVAQDGLNDVFLGFRPARSARRGRERLGGDTHLREGGTAPGVVDDVSDNTLDVTMALGVVLSGGRGWVGVSPAFGDGVSTRACEAKNTRTPGGAAPGAAASRCFERSRGRESIPHAPRVLRDERGARRADVRAARRRRPEAKTLGRARFAIPHDGGLWPGTYRLAMLGFALALGGVRGENRPRTLTLSPDDTPHLDDGWRSRASQRGRARDGMPG